MGAPIDAILGALDAGMTAIDTAPLYGYGESERAIGEASIPRQVAVLTKVGLRWDDAHGEVLFRDGARVVRKDSRPESVLLEIERSLGRLRRSSLDLVQVHHRDRRVPLAETMGALGEAVRSGAVKRVGVSNFSAEDSREAKRALGEVPLVGVQSPYSLLAREAEKEGLRAASEAGLAFLAYSPLAQGLLSGAYGPEREVHDWRRTLPLFSVRSRTAIRDAIDGVVRPIARARGATVSQIALAWVIARRGVTCAIAGGTNAAQARESAGAMAITLDERELATLDRTFRKVRVDRGTGLRARVRTLLGR